MPVAVPPGYLNNGIKLDPISAETVESDGRVWNIEALGQSGVNFGIDYNNAHVQSNGTYIYPMGTFAQEVIYNEFVLFLMF